MSQLRIYFAFDVSTFSLFLLTIPCDIVFYLSYDLLYVLQPRAPMDSNPGFQILLSVILCLSYPRLHPQLSSPTHLHHILFYGVLYCLETLYSWRLGLLLHGRALWYTIHTCLQLSRRCVLNCFKCYGTCKKEWLLHLVGIIH